ncbi:MAG: ABC transporter ATP-binding protein [Candidatus Caldatribacteriota bacterium]
MKTLLEIKNLKTHFFTHEGIVKAVDGVSLKVDRGKTLGIVGESGSGKSVTALSILRLIPQPPGKIIGGEIYFEGQDLLKLDNKEIRKIRGKKISMIFQEPMTSLDPVFTIGHEIIETIQLHQGLNKKEAKEKALEILKIVGIPDVEKRIDSYPHELSGGMRQRVMIAMALSCHPTLLIADEPTTALDVTIQAQIIKLINDLKNRFHTSVILITHDLGVIAEMCDYVAVMYAGQVVEYAEVFTLFEKSLHPYTQALNKSIPRLNKEVEQLQVIPGMVPNLLNLPAGCPFHPRCSYSFEKCRSKNPELIEVEDSHLVKCHLFTEKR